MKSLARFQCVCTQWRSLTHQHYFLHKKLVSTRRRRQRLTIIQKSSTEKIDVYELDHDHHEGGGTRSAGNYYSINLNIDDPIPTADDDDDDDDDGESEYILSNSVHGLVACVRESPTHKLSHYLLNPIHQDLFVKLPDPPSLQIHKKSYIFAHVRGIGLGFDDATGEYKVVRLSYREQGKFGIVCEILTLGGRGRVRGRDHNINWRYVAEFPPNVDIVPRTPVFLHGVLHWNGHFLPPRHEELVIVTFDIKEEKFGPLIPFPNAYDCERHVVVETLYEFKGHVCVVFIDYNELKMNIWMLEEDYEWTRLCCFQKRYAPFWVTGDLQVIGITDERILFLEPTTDEDATICTWQLFAYHLHKKKLQWLQCPLQYSDLLEIHQERFLSPREFFSSFHN